MEEFPPGRMEKEKSFRQGKEIQRKRKWGGGTGLGP